MKHAKRIASLVLALVMVLALSAGVFAAGSNTITVAGAQKNETYNVYKMLDLTVNEDKTAFAYSVNADWNAFFTGSGVGAAYIVIDKVGHVTWNVDKNDAASMETFAKAAAAFAAENGISAAAGAITPAEDGNITFTGLDSGYYLITSTNGSLAMTDTTPTNPDATVHEKNVDPSLDKEVMEDSTSGWSKGNSAQIGDTVSFRLIVTLHKGAKNYVVHDKMDAGLTFKADSVAVEATQTNGLDLEKGRDYTVVTEGLTDDCTFEIRFTEAFLNTITQSVRATFTYEAVLNEKAEIAGAKNDAQLTWGDKSASVWNETVTKTHQFEVRKYATGDSQKTHLAGAVFQLKDKTGAVVKLVKVSDTEYRVANGEEAGAQDTFVTVANGNIVIKGVDLDSYTLTEIEAPAGYNKLADAIEVVVEAQNNLVVEIENNTGTELPSTGGMGTTLFYIVGAALVLGAVVVLVTRKRMKNN